MTTQSARWYDAFYRESDYAWEAAELTRLIRARRPGATTLLDVGCGSGRHLGHLHAAFSCTGVDVDASALALARSRLPREVRLQRADMTTLDLGRRFDAVTCLFSAIGYAATLSKLRETVSRLAGHLAPGGVLVVEPWLLAETWEAASEPTVEHVPFGGGALVRVIAMSRRGSRSRLHVHYAHASRRGVRVRDETHDLGVFTEAAYADAFRRAGLDVDFDPVGLTRRGLFVATAGQP